jgi:hypothetical protein
VVRVHLAEGNLAEAMRAYCAFRNVLAAELGVAPTQQMEELIAVARGRVHVRTRDAATISRSRPAAVVPAAVPALPVE